jgi:phosphatidylinositol kinase/protein kinase (PI-3  family)
MDKLWLENDLDLEMLTYNVMETGFKVGYIEFVDESVVFSEIHKMNGGIVKGPLNEKSLFNYFRDNLVSHFSSTR